jgi:hypothetical protein
VAPEHRLNQVLHWHAGGFKIAEATLVRERGLRPRAEVDAALAVLLAQVDGARTIAEILDRTAQTIAQQDDREPVRSQALTAIRELLAHGFLVLQT